MPQAQQENPIEVSASWKKKDLSVRRNRQVLPYIVYGVWMGPNIGVYFWTKDEENASWWPWCSLVTSVFFNHRKENSSAGHLLRIFKINKWLSWKNNKKVLCMPNVVHKVKFSDIWDYQNLYVVAIHFRYHFSCWNKLNLHSTYILVFI